MEILKIGENTKKGYGHIYGGYNIRGFLPLFKNMEIKSKHLYTTYDKVNSREYKDTPNKI